MKKLNLSLLILLAFFSIIGFTGCKDPESAHEHTFSDAWSKDGTYHWHDATCEHTTEVSDKVEHTFGDWQVTKEATCIEKGERKASCTVCDFEKTEVSDKVAHSFGEYVSNNDATTDADGTKTRECSVCGYKDTVTDEGSKIHVHTFAESWSKDATYHWHAATCEHTTEVTEKAEHTFGEYVSNNDATTETDGTKTRTCEVCDYAETVTDEGSKIIVPENFVLIPAGTYTMGNNAGGGSSEPVHEVTITNPFYMGKYEVTQVEYEKYCSYAYISPSSDWGDGDNYPVYYVRWYDALVYCNKRSIAEGLTPCYSISGNTNPSKWGTVPYTTDETWDAVICNWNANGYRLPTEAEWEYAARAGDNSVNTLTWSGTISQSKLGDYAWYDDNSANKTHEVGVKKPNSLGLYDMSGNVCEWCWNWYTSSYDTEKEGGTNPTGSSSGSGRVERGGCFNYGANGTNVSGRGYFNPYYYTFCLGFRVVRSALAQ